MIRTLTALTLILLATPVFAQDAPKLSPELLLKQQILSLQVQLKDERTKNAQITVVYGQCASALNETQKLDPLFEKFKSDVEAANPGFSYDVEKGTFSKIEPVKK